MSTKPILIVTEIFDIGGLETYICGEINQLSKIGWQVHLACGKRFRPDLVSQLTASITSGLALGPEATQSDLMETVRMLKEIIEMHDVRVVHAHPFTALFPSLIAAELTRIPLVISLHGPASLSTSYGPYYDFLLNSIILPSAELVVAVSEEVRALAAPYVRESALIVQHNAVSIDEFQATHVVQTDSRWLIVSRLDAFKIVGIREFILFAQTVGIPGVVVAGDGPARELLQEQLTKDGLLEYVECIGTRADIPALMRRFSGIAGMGRVVLEGIASERPVCLVGYDGVKGFLDPTILIQAAKSNFSGRNFSNISIEDFARQLFALENSPPRTSTGMLRMLHDEAVVWTHFSNVIDQIKVNKIFFATDLYAWIESNVTGKNIPYLFSLETHQAIDPLAHSHRYPDSDSVIMPSHLHYQQMAERDAQIIITSLNQAMAERNEQIANLNQAVIEWKTQITCLNQTVAKYEEQVTSLNQALVERDALITAMRNSTSWRLTRPLRFVARVLRYGLPDDARQRLLEELRTVYLQIPLPLRARKTLGNFKRMVGKAYQATRRNVLTQSRFQYPAISPAEQQISVPDYIFWGVIDWHFRHQRPQQLAQALAASGRRVFYVSASLIDDERSGFDLEPLDGAGFLFQIKLYVLGAPVIYSSAPGIETISQLRLSIGEMLEWANSRQVVSVIQHPFWYNIATVLPNSRIVYDCMDHHEGFSNTATEILSLERALFRDADLTVTTSEWLDQIVAEHTKHRALIRNAGDFKHFAHPPATIYQDPEKRCIIGYYGAIAEWFDQDLVEAIAKHFPDCCVLLIGADTVNAQTQLGRLPNVKLIGEVPYEILPFYLHSFDVCLLPFKVVPLTLATNPVKVYEYLSAGGAVISVDLPEMKQFGELVKTAKNTEGILSAIGDALDKPASSTVIGQRQAFAREQTWTHRVDALITHAEATENDPKVSIVVVTYNNLDLTRSCLQSLDEHNNYAPLEIIVVDNASVDGTKEFLSEWVNTAQNRKLILNEENRGFSAANNQGLAAANGEYLVILNNDTYVTPGWVRTLVKHLQRDKSLGLIGPVTNNIGNEAKIDIAYASMNEMLETSARYTRRHIGQIFPLSTAAFFCVMMSRSVYVRTGPLDEAFGRGFFEDDDYCRRIEQLKLRIVCAKDVFIHHHLSASFNKLKSQDRQSLFERNKAIYEAKWGKWNPHIYGTRHTVISKISEGAQHLSGLCNVCGNNARFFYKEISLWRESLSCEHCLTTSRYRSVTRGILHAISELRNKDARSLVSLPRTGVQHKLRVYDTQPPFYYESCAYPLPDLLRATGWIDVALSQYKPKRPLGDEIAPGVVNQNLECLTFDDASFDIVITSDVMEHVRLDDRAHREIHRVLRPGGIYIFTVPHNRAWEQTLIRIQINDPDDQSKDIHLLKPEYHGDTNSDEGIGVIAYRTYGRDIEIRLAELGFKVEYFREDISEHGIFNTELYYCRKIK